MSYWDYDEPVWEPSEADELFDEMKSKLVEAAKASLKNDMESLKRRNEYLEKRNIVYYNADIVGVFHGDQSLIQDHFNRIGQYDFTKPEVKKIDHFEYTYPCSEKSLTAKINELVDAVNELREKL